MGLAHDTFPQKGRKRKNRKKKRDKNTTAQRGRERGGWILWKGRKVLFPLPFLESQIAEKIKKFRTCTHKKCEQDAGGGGSGFRFKSHAIDFFPLKYLAKKRSSFDFPSLSKKQPLTSVLSVPTVLWHSESWISKKKIQINGCCSDGRDEFPSQNPPPRPIIFNISAYLPLPPKKIQVFFLFLLYLMIPCTSRHLSLLLLFFFFFFQASSPDESEANLSSLSLHILLLQLRRRRKSFLPTAVLYDNKPSRRKKKLDGQGFNCPPPAFGHVSLASLRNGSTNTYEKSRFILANPTYLIFPRSFFTAPSRSPTLSFSLSLLLRPSANPFWRRSKHSSLPPFLPLLPNQEQIRGERGRQRRRRSQLSFSRKRENWFWKKTEKKVFVSSSSSSSSRDPLMIPFLLFSFPPFVVEEKETKVKTD